MIKRLESFLSGGRGLLDVQPHWVSALAWPKQEAESLWCGEPKDMLLVGRMDGSLGLIEVLDTATMHRTELEHCYRKDGMKREGVSHCSL